MAIIPHGLYSVRSNPGCVSIINKTLLLAPTEKEMSETKSWGYHLIVNAAKCDAKAMSDKDVIYKFVKELVKEIDMVAYGEPQIVRFGTGNKAGYTLVQLIETSNICVHFADENREIYLDVFSCKEFEPKIVLNVLKKYFKNESFNMHFLERQAW
jgi:S-adenosylmethionine/arginine decarboxylase-like enzyme